MGEGAEAAARVGNGVVLCAGPFPPTRHFRSLEVQKLLLKKKFGHKVGGGHRGSCQSPCKVFSLLYARVSSLMLALVQLSLLATARLLDEAECRLV